MATNSGKSRGLTFGRSGAEGLAQEKSKGYEDMGLLLALIVLLGWAVFVGVRAVDWPSVSHALSAVVAWIR
ncbi:MAG: hypothetical protein EPN47_05745 [Acidobacteria bacterium]|nr:MAG: hypothetical protein EPN47_05745 [Acidobacteriota bacterium]